MTARWLTFLLVAGFALFGSIVGGLLAERPRTPLPVRDFGPDFDAHWSQTADLFTPEEGRHV